MFNFTVHAFAVLLLVLPTVLAASKAYVELVNGTPYDWHLVSNETSHMKWFPNTTIPSGIQTASCSYTQLPILTKYHRYQRRILYLMDSISTGSKS